MVLKDNESIDNELDDYVKPTDLNRNYTKVKIFVII